MLKIIKYSFYDLIRGRWSLFYLFFYLILSLLLLFLNNDISKAVITLMNLIIILVPLIGTIFGVMYFYSTKEFTELLLALPVKRTSVFWGQYLGVAMSLSMSLVLGLGIPFAIYGLLRSDSIWDFFMLIVSGVFLTFIFTALSFLVSLANDNRIRGFGFAVLIWLFLAVVYDGIFLMLMMMFEDYPLDYFALAGVMLNPIDLSRTLILLKLDISALMGYTGAVFKEFFGTASGMVISLCVLVFWVVLPFLGIGWLARRKDF